MSPGSNRITSGPMNRKILMLAAIMAAAPVFAAGASVYKWTDDSGITHFGDRQPNGASAEIVNVRTGKSSCCCGLTRDAWPPELLPVRTLTISADAPLGWRSPKWVMPLSSVHLYTEAPAAKTGAAAMIAASIRIFRFIGPLVIRLLPGDMMPPRMRIFFCLVQISCTIIGQPGPCV